MHKIQSTRRMLFPLFSHLNNSNKCNVRQMKTCMWHQYTILLAVYFKLRFSDMKFLFSLLIVVFEKELNYFRVTFLKDTRQDIIQAIHLLRVLTLNKTLEKYRFLRVVSHEKQEKFDGKVKFNTIKKWKSENEEICLLFCWKQFTCLSYLTFYYYFFFFGKISLYENWRHFTMRINKCLLQRHF